MNKRKERKKSVGEKKKKEKKVGNEKIRKRLCGKTKKYLGKGGGGTYSGVCKRSLYILYIYIYILWTRPRDASRDGFLRK